MTSDAGRMSLGRAAGFAWAITISYLISGILGMTGYELLGPRHAEWSLELARLFCLVSCILVFPSALVFCAIGSSLVPSAFERRSPWRALLAGVLIATTFYSGILERGMGMLNSWSVEMPFARTVVGAILLFVTPFAIGVTLSCLVSWLLPPWRKATVPRGGCGGDFLPPGASHLAK